MATWLDSAISNADAMIASGNPKWGAVMTIMLRSMIGDTLSPYQYPDDRLMSLLTVGGVLVCREVTLPNTYQIDLTGVTISPDPTGQPEFGFAFDQDFVALTCLRTTVLIADGEYRNSAKIAISHRDGPSQVDARGVAENLKTIAASRAKAYESARIIYEVGNGSVGRSILAPYNAFISVYAGNVSTLNTGANRDDTASSFGGYG